MESNGRTPRLFGFSILHMMAHAGDTKGEAAVLVQAFCAEGKKRFNVATARLAAIYRAEAPFHSKTYGEAVAAHAECTALLHHFDQLKGYFTDSDILTYLEEAHDSMCAAALDATRHFRHIQTWFQRNSISVQALFETQEQKTIE